MISKQTLYTFLITFLLLLMAGCSTSKEEVKKVKTIGEFDNAPTWVQSANTADFISKVAKSEKISTDFTTQRDDAIFKAKEQLSNDLTTKLNTIFNLLIVGEVNADNELYKTKSDTLITYIVKNAMQNAKITNLWQSYSQNIYVKIATPVGKINKDILSSIKSTFVDMSFVSSNYKLYEEQGKIDKILK